LNLNEDPCGYRYVRFLSQQEHYWDEIIFYKRHIVLMLVGDSKEKLKKLFYGLI